MTPPCIRKSNGFFLPGCPPAVEIEYTYLKVYAANACKANMLKILQKRIGAERVITFGSIPGQYDVYVHDDGGNSAVKMLKKLYEGQLL